MAYEPIHPPDALQKNLPASKHLGTLSTDAALSVQKARRTRKKTQDETRVEKALKERPPISRMLSLADLEVREVYRCH